VRAILVSIIAIKVSVINILLNEIAITVKVIPQEK
jgi:hypothetical protein